MGGTRCRDSSHARVAMMTAPRHHLFRARGEHDHSPVTYIELFFDLVFVFAITQLSHRFIEHLDYRGAAETMLLLLAVWWVWIYTSWSTNWLDPDRANVRLMLLVMMAMGLVLSASIPDAFGTAGLAFALAYCAMQLFRTLYMAWAATGVNDARTRNFLRIAFWFLLALPFWIAGALSPADMRLGLWTAALAIEYVGPFLFFWTPLLGRSTIADWDISGAHMAERCALFIIIVLGEAVLMTGATFSETARTQAYWMAFLGSFVGSAAMWWIYFDIGAKRGADTISASGNAGLMARNAYTYLHIPIVAGVVLTAVGDEMLIMHPLGHSDNAMVITMVGGPALFLLGNQAFKWSTAGVRFPPLSHFIGLALLIIVAAAAFYLHWQPLTVGLAATGALVFTAIWEWCSQHGGWQRWAPWMAPLFSRNPQN
jgi:low temperature requirement protein LtrA